MERIKRLLVVLIAFVFLTGCSDNKSVEASFDNTEASVETKETPRDSSKNSMLSEPEIAYEVPSVYPQTVVSIGGYEPERDKEAILYAESLPAEFVVKNSSTDEVVFHGYVKRKVTESSDEKITGIADFSDLTEEGTYYIETEILGKSKDFSIKSRLYDDMLKTAYAGLWGMRCDSCHKELVPFENDASRALDISGGFHQNEEGEKDVVEGCLFVMDLCTAYEYYPKAFSDDNGLPVSDNKLPDIVDAIIFEANWLMKMQNPDTGGVYTSVSLQEQVNHEKVLVVGGETTRATTYFCAAMAKISMTLSKLDVKVSRDALSAAISAWSCLDANKDIVTTDQMYRASVEMYRVTGNSVYNQIVLNYLKNNADSIYDGRVSVDAAITYLSTARSTNVSYCTSLMARLMSRTEDKVSAAKLSRYAIESEELSADDLLRNTYEMIVVDYIIQNREYEQVEEDYLHYLSGRNATMTNYLDTLENPDSYAKLIALLSKLANTRK